MASLGRPMPCFHPIRGYIHPHTRRFTPSRQTGLYSDVYRHVPCGRCIGCKLEHSRQWAVRCVHESRLHEQNAFITLTYAPEYLPPGGTLDRDHLTKFLKRLRKRRGKRLRYLACGEYGDKKGRAHYHLQLFGDAFIDDRRFHKMHNGNPLYRSQTLESLWPYGHSNVAGANFATAAYIARYSLKKRNHEQHDHIYVDKPTGVIREREYVTMSRMPGIGFDWLDQNFREVYRKDQVVINGHASGVPKAYDRHMEDTHPDFIEEIRSQRQRKALERGTDRDPDRLSKKEFFQIARQALAARDLGH